MANEIPPPRRFPPAHITHPDIRHPAFQGDPAQLYLGAMQSRVEVAEGTVHAFERRLWNAAARRPSAPQHARLPRGDVRAMIEAERGPAMWVVYETLLGPQAQRDVAWRCHDEHAVRKHINEQAYIEPVAPEYQERESASRARSLLEPVELVRRELGRHVAQAIFEPRPETPRHFERPQDREAFEKLRDRFTAISARATSLAIERLSDRVRAGGPVFPHALLLLLLSRDLDRTGRGMSMKQLFTERCPPDIAQRVVAMLGNPVQLGKPIQWTPEELKTPSSLLGMFGLSLLQGHACEEFDWSPAILHAEQTPEYQDMLRRRALLEATGLAWVPPDRDDPRHRQGHRRDLFSDTG